MTHPPQKRNHGPHDVYERRIIVRPFVVFHEVGKDAEDTLQRVRALSETLHASHLAPRTS